MIYFLKDCTKKVLKMYKSIAVENFKPMPLCPLKWWPLKFFAKLRKSPLLISNIVKGAVSGLRQFLTTESPWKIMNNTFYFILTNWICYWQIRFCINSLSANPTKWSNALKQLVGNNCLSVFDQFVKLALKGLN